MYTKLICLCLLGSVMFVAAENNVKLQGEGVELQSCEEEQRYYEKCPCETFENLKDLDNESDIFDSLNEDTDMNLDFLGCGFPLCVAVVPALTLEMTLAYYPDCIVASLLKANQAYYGLEESNIEVSSTLGVCFEDYANKVVDIVKGPVETIAIEEAPESIQLKLGPCNSYEKQDVQICLPLCCKCCADLSVEQSGCQTALEHFDSPEAELCFPITMYWEVATSASTDIEIGDQLTAFAVEDVCPEPELLTCRGKLCDQCARLSCQPRSERKSNKGSGGYGYGDYDF